MAKKPTTADAQVVLQLYDFRREAEMRKARSWWAGSFWPQSAEDIMKVSNNFGSPENTWYRQVIGYWEMCASLVLRGALHEELFFDSGAELWFTLARVYPVLKDFRAKTNSPQLLLHSEQLATRTKQGKERLQRMVKMTEGWRQARGIQGH
jgi:hypothetical protein